MSWGYSFGRVKLLDNDTIFSISYNGTVRFVVNKSTGFITIGAVDGAMGSGSLAVSQAYHDDVHIGNGLSSGSDSLNVTGDSTFSGKVTISGTSSFFKLPVLTSTQRDALTGSAGMVIYNSTTGKINVYTTVWEVVDSAGL